jgi:hypothetical protein
MPFLIDSQNISMVFLLISKIMYLKDYCYDRFKTVTMNDFVCGSLYSARTSVGPINPLPPSAGAALPPSSSPAPSNAIPPPSLTSPSQQQTITTCPDGSAPDANGNCPTTTTNQQLAPSQSFGGSASNNNDPTPEHHHKGSNQPTQTGGQESTVTKKHKGQKADQGTTQSPS